MSGLYTGSLSAVCLHKVLHISSLCKYVFRNTSRFQERQKRGFMKRAGRGKGESKEADEIFSASCQKLLQAKKWSDGETKGKQVERRGNQARTHCTRLHCEPEFGSDTKQSRGVEREPERSAQVRGGEVWNKARWFPISRLDRVRNQRYQAGEQTGPSKLSHMPVNRHVLQASHGKLIQG